MFSSGLVKARILADFHLLLMNSAHDKRWDEHDSSRRYDLHVGFIHYKSLVIKVGQSDTQAAIQTLLLYPSLDLGNNFVCFEVRQGTPLIDQLTENAIPFAAIFLVHRYIGRKRQSAMQDHHIALHRLDVRFGFLYRANEQTTVLVESHPLRQKKLARRGNKWGLHFTALISISIFDNCIACLRDGRFGCIVIHRNGWNLFIVEEAIRHRTTCWQEILDHVHGGGIAQQSRADSDSLIF